jgi:hypothetical protein
LSISFDPEIGGAPQIKIFLQRSLNPLLARYIFENFNIPPKNNIFLDSILAKPVSVVTFWRHGFVEEF